MPIDYHKAFVAVGVVRLDRALSVSGEKQLLHWELKHFFDVHISHYNSHLILFTHKVVALQLLSSSSAHSSEPELS